ncbi:CopD family protein [Gordonia sp. PKS22-38]|uniref:CopD family protein n=1 Tax=Gordonia prachuapensis TaxID=3115651 RepID=A0ABU7MT80_9ACTN|nr:CopD family protein [Gordonia sp. PKS22-38]
MTSGAGRTASPNTAVRAAALGGGLIAMFVGLGLCWILAAPDGPSATAVPNVVALGAAVLIVGLGALPTLGLDPTARMIGLAGAAWFVAVAVAAWMRTADQTGRSPGEVGIDEFGDTLSAGAPELVTLLASAAVVVVAGLHLTGRVEPPAAAYGILAAIGVLATAITGHAGGHAIGPVLVGAHALGAAWWCGTLAAMVLVVRGRRGWASALPDFSSRALWAVAVIAATGVISGLLETGLGDLVDTGYGRILLAKTAGLVLLIGLGVYGRQRWVPAVTRHRLSENTSLRLSLVELVVMGAVLGLAVGLSGTAP